MIEFEGWPATPRLNRDAVYTEKLDGTNAAVVIESVDDPSMCEVDGLYYDIGAQSRNRLVTPGADNHGFATWVAKNAIRLIRVLGPGRHFGEWYGSGIQRGYGLTEKRFALFNTARWDGDESLSNVPGLECVTVLRRGVFSTETAKELVSNLRFTGSAHVPGFARPEGVCVFHTASRTVYKTFLENDDVPKGPQ